MILFIDNYDSFVYNLARYVSELGFQYQVTRNNVISLADIKRLNPSHIIISPGPCIPNEAGIALDLIREFASTIPILGVCLGHQAIGQAFGARVVRAGKAVHGKSSEIHHDGQAIFHGLENPLQAGRYHSLIVSEDNFPPILNVTARSADNQIMALRHRDYPVFGVQFHPESVLTTQGHELLNNFINL